MKTHRQTAMNTTTQEHRYAYYDLVDYDIRLDKEIHLMKKRIAKIAVDEVKYQARQQFLDSYLAELKEREVVFQAEDKPEKYKKRTLKRLQKEIDKARGRWHANRWRLSVVSKRKRKDNPAKLILKEIKQAEVQVRMQAIKQTILKLEELEHVVKESLVINEEPATITTLSENTVVAISIYKHTACIHVQKEGVCTFSATIPLPYGETITCFNLQAA
ncbi:hypothetical protein [Xanthocytophaga agilis]|uniref:Uncharacterized protein n=1 Tax=Xanthocytophaga agilis TaxID=3048010 RepID=A0AAE3R5B2_9BACT|nr:hypothetical protein [Xanthocytophaga agilis]MDJ1501098.1 hypothetical protein [Xanthocytophaga agilis]